MFAPNDTPGVSGTSMYAVAIVSYRLAETPDHLQGRVISAFRTLSYGAEPLGLAAGGLAVTLARPSLLFIVIGVALILCVGAIMRKPSVSAATVN